jgi:hypothetical protein
MLQKKFGNKMFRNNLQYKKDKPNINDDIISFVPQDEKCAVVKIGQSLAVITMSNIINMPSIPGLEKNIVDNILYLKNTSGFLGQLVMALDFNIAIQGFKNTGGNSKWSCTGIIQVLINDTYEFCKSDVFNYVWYAQYGPVIQIPISKDFLTYNIENGQSIKFTFGFVFTDFETFSAITMCNKTTNGTNTFFIKSIYFNIYDNDKCNYYINIPQLTIGKNDGPQQITTGSINCTLYFNNIINIPPEAYTGLYIYINGDAVYFKNTTTTTKNLFFGFNIKCSVQCTANGIFTGFNANGNIRFYVNSGKDNVNENKTLFFSSDSIQFGQTDCGTSYDVTKDIIMSQIIKVPIPADYTILFSLQFYCSIWQGTCNGGPPTFINLNGGGRTTCQITFFNYVDA